MTTKPKRGTLGTRGSADKERVPKVTNVSKKIKELLGLKRVRYTTHANERMGERNVIRAEVMQALSKGKHIPRQDRFSDAEQSWAYSIEGVTLDKRSLRIGVSFECDPKSGDLLLIITVIDLQK